tara:strand:- start:4259 stop:5191 length:933 start_codon:yes stop_codon:yes gene_type:complete
VKIHHINLDSLIDNQLFHLAIGNFDGVHLGHQQIISSLVKQSKKEKKLSAILSFNPHPRQFFSREFDRYQIISEEKKQNIFDKLGIEHYFSLKFDEVVSNLSPVDFITKIIVQKLKVEKLIVGYDFHFGKDRKGDTNLLLENGKIHGFSVEIVQPIINRDSDEIYSSTAIRESIKNGQMEKTNKMLGRTWTMEGTVIQGDKRARQMNFPTANILPHKQIYPLRGVYAVKSLIMEKNYFGIANFGERPTVNGKKLLLEVHLFDFDQDIYGKHLTVEFLTFIRDEKKFDNFELLSDQIKKDIQIVKNHLLSK